MVPRHTKPSPPETFYALLEPEVIQMSRTPKHTAPQGTRAPRSADAQWLTTAEAAHYLGYATQTLYRKRCEGSGPPFRRPSPGMVRYLRSELDAWMNLPSASSAPAPDMAPDAAPARVA